MCVLQLLTWKPAKLLALRAESVFSHTSLLARVAHGWLPALHRGSGPKPPGSFLAGSQESETQLRVALESVWQVLLSCPRKAEEGAGGLQGQNLPVQAVLSVTVNQVKVTHKPGFFPKAQPPH